MDYSLVDEIKGLKEIIKAIKIKHPETTAKLALSYVGDTGLKERVRRLKRTIPMVPENVNLSFHNCHDVKWIQNELKHLNNDDDRWYMHEMMKMAVVFEDIYCGIFAGDERYSDVIENKHDGIKSRSFYYKLGDEWRVDVLSAGGELLFTYIGLFEENCNDEDGPCPFLCVVMCQSDSGMQRVEFDNFHDLIYFFIDLVLPGGQWTSQDDERPASTSRSAQRVEFDNLHDLIYFFIDLVLPGGRWTS